MENLEHSGKTNLLTCKLLFGRESASNSPRIIEVHSSYKTKHHG